MASRIVSTRPAAVPLWPFVAGTLAAVAVVRAGAVMAAVLGVV